MTNRMSAHKTEMLLKPRLNRVLREDSSDIEIQKYQGNPAIIAWKS
jgi:hypothetical protein